MPAVINQDVKELVDRAMDKDDERTAVRLKKMLWLPNFIINNIVLPAIIRVDSSGECLLPIY